MDIKSISDVTPTNTTSAAASSTTTPFQSIIPLDQSSSSETDPQQHPDEFFVTSNRLTLDYVSSNVATPSKTLVNAVARSDFVSAVFGDVNLGKFAENDPPLLQQLQSRLNIIINKATPVINAPSHHVDVDALIAVFALIAARWPILVDIMERQGVILTIVNAMRSWSHRSALVARCMTALRVFSVNDAARKRVMVDGGLTLTLELVGRYSNDPRIQMRAAAVIANVAFGCTHRKRRIVRQGGVRKVLNGMKAFPDNEHIQLRGALTIRNLTHETQVNQFIAGNEGAVEIISASLLRFRNINLNPELRFHCVMALESLCREDEGNRKRIADIDNFDTTMTKSLSWDSSGIIPKRSLKEFDRVNEDGDIVVEEEEVLLSNVTAKYKHGEALLPGRTSRRIDGPGSRTKSATHAIGNENRYGNADWTKEDRGRSSLVRVIVHSIRRDPDDVLLVETALSLLTLISMQRSSVQLRIGNVGGMQVAIAAMRRHPQHAGIISKASGLVRVLCFQDINRGQVTSGLVVMISAVRKHRSDSETTREVISALSNAVHEHEKNRSSTVNKGGVDAIVQAMSDAGNKDVMVLEAGVCALRNFVAASESGALCAANDGAIRAAVSALEQTKETKIAMQRFVQEQCVLFLGDMARMVPHTKHEMLELRTIENVERTLRKLSSKEYDQLHYCADELLLSLIQLRRKKTNVMLLSGPPSTTPAAAPAVISGKGFSRSLLGRIGFGRRPPVGPRSSSPKSNRKSTAASVDSTSVKRVFTLSGRLRKSKALS